MLEMLPYFIVNTYGTSVPLVVEFFEKLSNNELMYDCFKDVDISVVINYIKNCSVHGAYDKLKQILSKYKFIKYFDDVTEDDKDQANKMDRMGFDD